MKTHIRFDYSVKRLLKMTEELHLEELNGVKNVIDELDIEDFPDLKYLYICNAPELHQIVNLRGWGPFSAFPNLEVLFLRNLIKLEKLFQARFKDTAFSKLRTITIECCHHLKNLFSSSIASQFLQLQEIRVSDCSNMEEIIDHAKEQRSREDIVEASQEVKPKFGQLLRSLRLQRLPKLISFNSDCSTMPLFNDQFLFPNLEELQLSWINVDMIRIASYCVENLTKLIIHGCHNLKYIFSSTMARSLEKLGHLEIRECKMMTKVLSKENEEEKENLIFPALKFLQLKQLQNLVSFYFGDSTIEFSSLNELAVRNCPEFKGFAVMSTSTDVAADNQPLFNEQVGFAGLEDLILSDFPELIEIWHVRRRPQEILDFRLLKYLQLYNCAQLSYLLTPSMVFCLVRLKFISIKNCAMMEQVIMGDGEESKMILQLLWRIELESCSNLISFYVGSHSLEIPSLQIFSIKECQRMVTFAASTSSGEHEKETSHQYFFSCKVEIPALGQLMLSSIKIQQIWHCELTSVPSFAQNLRELMVTDCDNLRYLFTSSMVKVFTQLEKLEIYGCKAMEVVILMEGLEEEEEERMCQTMFPKLETLVLSNLSRLIRFCSNSNSQLEERSETQGLNASGSQVVPVIKSTLEHTEATKLVFPQLKYLELCDLQKFKGFFSQMHIIEWPSLKR
ncbi:hypothetical protein SLEP1_g55764, partial [Rubroshorea leprosula]